MSWLSFWWDFSLDEKSFSELWSPLDFCYQNKNIYIIYTQMRFCVVHLLILLDRNQSQSVITNFFKQQQQKHWNNCSCCCLNKFVIIYIWKVIIVNWKRWFFLTLEFTVLILVATVPVLKENIIRLYFTHKGWVVGITVCDSDLSFFFLVSLIWYLLKSKIFHLQMLVMDLWNL